MLRTPLTQDWLTSFNGVGPATATKLAEKYDSLEDLSRASAAQLAGDLKVSKTTISAVVRAARELLSTNRELAAEGKLEPPEIPDEVEDDEEVYTIRKRAIDQFTVKRERVLVTPSVCVMCGYDAAQKMGAEGWDTLPEEMKLTARKLLQKHQELHTMGEVGVLRKSQLPSVSLRSVGAF